MSHTRGSIDGPARQRSLKILGRKIKGLRSISLENVESIAAALFAEQCNPVKREREKERKKGDTVITIFLQLHHCRLLPEQQEGRGASVRTFMI